MQKHPNILDLELYRTGEAPEEVRSHVDACPSCRSQVRGLEIVAEALTSSETPPCAETFAGVDDAVMQVIAKTPGSHLSVVLRRYVVPAAAAALVVLGTFAVVSRQSPSVHTAQAAHSAGCDVNGDGHVDILDPLGLARRIERGADLNPEWDLDGDGHVGQEDVLRLTERVVDVGTGNGDAK